jgi:hypothetical protein
MPSSCTSGADDRVLLDDSDDDDHEDAHDHAWCDKIRGVPVGANLPTTVKDSRGRPMQMLLELVTYDDWFLWSLWVSEDYREAKMEIVRG